MANTFFIFTASNLAERVAPSGANNTVKGTIQQNAPIFKKPYVLGGASIGVWLNRKIVNTLGNEIRSPIAEAVPMALCTG